MVHVQHKRASVSKVGVEIAHGFGDCLFHLPLIKAISEKYDTKVAVATRSHCVDAFINIPWVDRVFVISSMGAGGSILEENGYLTHFQITPNLKFFEFREHDPQHSLIDTALCTGRQLGLPDFDQKPIFIPTAEELEVGKRYVDVLKNITVESVYTSGQSWATQADFDLIVNKFRDSHRICWLSNSGAPQTQYTDDMLRWTRREIICALQHCDTMFSVGSGFFCAAMALPKEMQPPRIVCMWNDELYRYENRISELKLHDNIVWVHNQQELLRVL